MSFFSYAEVLITPISKDITYDEHKAILSKNLFDDPILSSDNTVPYALCPILSAARADNNRYALGVSNNVARINTPTVYNSVYNFKQTWNGRDPDLHSSQLERHVEEGKIEDIVEFLKTLTGLVPEIAK